MSKIRRVGELFQKNTEIRGTISANTESRELFEQNTKSRGIMPAEYGKQGGYFRKYGE